MNFPLNSGCIFFGWKSHSTQYYGIVHGQSQLFGYLMVWFIEIGKYGSTIV